MKALWLVFAGLVVAACGSGDDDDGQPAGSGGAQDSGRSGNGGSGADGAGNGGGVSGAAAGASGGDGGRGGGAGSAAGTSGSAGSMSAGSSAPGPAACMGKTSNHSSGSRVRVKRATTSEGDVSWLDFHDRERGFDCAFGRAADGMLRCLPAASARGSRYFADASCTDAVYAVPRACPIDYVLAPNPGSDLCTQIGPKVHARGAEHTGAVYVMSAGSCTGATIAADAIAYRLGPELPASDLAPGSEATWGDGAIALEGIEAEGGLRNARGFRDTKLDEPCRFEPLADGKEHCVNRADPAARYADSACRQEPLFSQFTLCGEKPATYAVGMPRERCGPNELRKITEVYTGTQYSLASGACAEAVGSAGTDLYSSVPADPSELPSIERAVVMDDAGRLKRGYRTSADGDCWFDAWYDSELGVRCHFRRTADGQFRCLPNSRIAELVDGFNDAACTQPARYMGTFAACPDDEAPVAFYERGALDAVCMTLPPRKVMGAPIAAADLPELYVQAGAACQRYTPSDAAYYRVGERMALGDFMSGAVSIE